MSTPTPLVSIVIPCWNGEGHVAQAIESALAQTYPHIEVIVVDDGSTDGTVSVLRRFGDSIFWESGANRGACAARNRGSEIASGKYLQFLDADDVLFPNKIETMLASATSGDATPICGWETITEFGTSAISLPGDTGADSLAYALSHSIQTAAPLHLRDRFWSVGGFRVEFPCAQERDLHIRLAASGVQFLPVNLPLLQARRRAGSLSSDPHRVLLQHERIFLSARDMLVQRGTLTDARRDYLARAFVRDARLLVRIGDFAAAARYAENARLLHTAGGLGEFRRGGARTLARFAGPVLAEQLIQATYSASQQVSASRLVTGGVSQRAATAASKPPRPRLTSTFREIVSGRALRRRRYKLEELRSMPLSERATGNHIEGVVEWLLRAQAATPDDGVAQGYHAVTRRWGSSYPETTGYIIGSLLRASDLGFGKDGTLTDAAIRMGNWLPTTQLKNGAFAGGTVAVTDPKPAIFNTGQILKGFSYLLERDLDPNGSIAQSAKKAADYMVETLDDDGCWRSGISALTSASVHAHNVRAAWGLARYGQVVGDERAIGAARANASWLCRQQRSDGWFDHMSFDDGEHPLTHSIAYTVQGLMEIGAQLRDDGMIERSRCAAKAIFEHQAPKTGAIPGQFTESCQPFGDFTSMTGNAQMAVVGYRLASLTGEPHWAEKAQRATSFCKRFHELDHADPNRRGGVRGAFPSNGGYGSFWYMNWTQKFFLDALLSELGVEVT